LIWLLGSRNNHRVDGPAARQEVTSVKKQVKGVLLEQIPREREIAPGAPPGAVDLAFRALR